jgi:peptidoglycan-associated lipoprotein
MNTRMSVLLTCVLGALTIAACGGEKKQATAPAVQPRLMTGTFQRVGATVGVSDDLAKACNLHLDESASAPKFEFDRTEVLAGDRTVLAKLAECLTTGPLKGRSLRLVGRTDARGEPQYNMVLGAHRASGIADYLTQLGLEPTRVALTSRGELDAVGTDDATAQVDRRVDIMLAQ